MENNNLEKVEKEYWGKSFYGSKLNTILLLILIVLMIFALRFMYQNKEIDNQFSLQQESINNSKEELIDVDVMNYKAGQDVPLSDNTPLKGLHIFGITGKNPSGLSPNRYIIIASEINFRTSDPRCGWGGNELNPRCLFFVKNSLGKIEKINEWPDSDLILNHKDFFNGDTFNMINNDVFVDFSTKDNLYFKHNFSLQCSGSVEHTTSFDLLTKKFNYYGGEIPLNDCD